MAVTSWFVGRGRNKVEHFEALSTDIKPGRSKWWRGGERGLHSRLEIADTGARYIGMGNEWVLVHDPAADTVEIKNLKSRATDGEQNHTSLLGRIEALERKPDGA